VPADWTLPSQPVAGALEASCPCPSPSTRLSPDQIALVRRGFPRWPLLSAAGWSGPSAGRPRDSSQGFFGPTMAGPPGLPATFSPPAYFQAVLQKGGGSAAEGGPLNAGGALSTIAPCSRRSNRPFLAFSLGALRPPDDLLRRCLKSRSRSTSRRRELRILVVFRRRVDGLLRYRASGLELEPASNSLPRRPQGRPSLQMIQLTNLSYCPWRSPPSLGSSPTSLSLQQVVGHSGRLDWLWFVIPAFGARRWLLSSGPIGFSSSS